MAAIAPWLQPTDYIGVMRAGAGLGLQARAQDVQEEEAGDRLRLAYTQIASQERQHAAQAKALSDYRLAQLELRNQQQSMLQDYRQKNMERQIEASKDSLDMRQKLLDNTIKHQADLMAIQKEKPTQLSPAVKAQQHVIDAKRRTLQSKLTNPVLFEQEVTATKNFLKQAGGRVPEDDEIRASVADNLNSMIEGYDQQYEQLGEAPTGLTPTPSGGKKLVYKGGKIVEE